jgi:flagellar protein FliS
MNAHLRQLASAAYRGASETVSPAQQIVMLYDGAIRCLREAEAAIAAGAIERRHNNVAKAFAIVNALHCCLDFEKGGEVARSLDRFYAYVLHRMSRIDITGDASICAELIGMLSQMRASWAAIASGSARSPSPPPAAPTRSITVST